MKVIVWSQQDGSLAVCIPSGHVPIEEVIQKDIPADIQYQINEIEDLPLALGDPLFAAVRLNNGKFEINLDAAREITRKIINQKATVELQQRNLNEALGITNNINNTTWSENLQAKRNSVDTATLEQLRDLLA